jgi:2-polyprenyl-3-methyl-5-hydroxy-6-metoxy-1,4-benzoquinol methylase
MSDSQALQKIYDVPAIADEASPRAISASSPCPLCEIHDAQRLYLIPDVEKQIVVCTTCGIGRIDPLPTAEELIAFYPSDYYGSLGQKFDSVVEKLLAIVSQRQIRRIGDRVPAGGRILDVGCGRGMLAKALVEAGFSLSGTDFSIDATRGIDRRIDLRICASLGEAGFEPESFDAIVIWHVFEHLVDPRAELDQITSLLKPGGRLFIAVPNFESFQARIFGPDWFHLDPPRHLYQFTERGLRAMLERNDFEIRSTHHFSLSQNPFGWIQSALNALPGAQRNALYCAMHNLPSPGVSGARGIGERLFNLIAAGPAIALSIVAAILRRGATVSFDAQKRGPR